MFNIEKPFLDWWKSNKENFDAILFDIDGTLFSGTTVLKGAVETVEVFRKSEFPFFLLTNDGNHSTQEKSGMMQNAGLNINPDEIVSCSMAIKSFVDENKCHGETFFVLGDLGNPCYAESAGLKVCRELKRIEECSGFIIGEGRYDWLGNITALINVLKESPEMPLLVPNPDSYWPYGNSGKIGIGAGGKARFVCTILGEMGIEKEPVYFGKPYSSIYEYTLRILKERFNLTDNLPHSRVLMLGDSLKSDILGANRCGITSGLMLTGITDMSHLENCKKELQPKLIFPCLLD